MKTDSFKDFVMDQLQRMPGVRAKAMFGGHGLYNGNNFFGIIYKGKLYFRTGPKTVSRYKQAGMKPFKPNAKMTLKNYYEVPVEVLEDPYQIMVWAAEAEQAQSDNSP
ncbi:MAG: TfoX/Sxy family protein [Candidatus Omnitrophica bacterium]|nr:TfoX/Sxy family protein [Candidatus Omnitrophota bacterium]